MNTFPHRNEVTIWPTAESILEEDGGITIDTDFVSLINAGTHGPPALVAPGRNAGENVRPVATVGQEVLYVNTFLVPLFTIKRVR
jgi:hypothetical protein